MDKGTWILVEPTNGKLEYISLPKFFYFFIINDDPRGYTCWQKQVSHFRAASVTHSGHRSLITLICLTMYLKDLLGVA